MSPIPFGLWPPWGSAAGCSGACRNDGGFGAGGGGGGNLVFWGRFLGPDCGILVQVLWDGGGGIGGDFCGVLGWKRGILGSGGGVKL